MSDLPPVDSILTPKDTPNPAVYRGPNHEANIGRIDPLSPYAMTGVETFKITPLALPEKVTLEDIAQVIVGEEYFQPEGTTLTICVLKLNNGGTATGESSTVTRNNFDAEIGKTMARKRAVDELFKMEGYALRKKRFEMGLRN